MLVDKPLTAESSFIEPEQSGFNFPRIDSAEDVVGHTRNGRRQLFQIDEDSIQIFPSDLGRIDTVPDSRPMTNSPSFKILSKQKSNVPSVHSS